jgi:hypothetical protein
MKKIIIRLYMGWKSTIAKELSKTIKVPFVDLDTYIEKSGIIHKCYFWNERRNQIQEDGAWSFCGIIAPGDAIIGLGEELLVMPITTNC